MIARRKLKNQYITLKHIFNLYSGRFEVAIIGTPPEIMKYEKVVFGNTVF